MKMMRGKRMKKISVFIALAILICAALSISALATEPPGVKGTTCYTHGDINADGSVTSKDAIRLLYYATIEDEYSVEQDCDFEADGVIDTKDAIHLLYSVNGLFADLFPEYKLDGVVHAYDEPIWTWNFEGSEPTAKATYQCACGEKFGIVYADVEVEQKGDPTCTNAGYINYSASATYADVNYIGTEKIILDATGHSYAETATCKDRACQNKGCSYIEKATGHSYDEPKVTEATCTAPKTTVYACKECDYKYEVQEGTALGHTLISDSLVETLVDKDTCEYKQVYTCSVCDKKVEGEHVHKHSYVATIEKEATCKEAGRKTFKCSACGDTSKKAETIEANENAHVWNKGVASGEITTYTCTLCDATRTTVNASTEKSATVSQDTLQSAGEVEVNNAAIKIDQATLGQLNKKSGDVVISVVEADKSKINISDADISGAGLDQVGENPVYDFNLTVDGEQVSNFEGTVTVKLPYTLQDGDDADSIDVWYIADNGKLEVVKGKYSNGYVIFTTDHFSYYTVTKLTPKQRCEKYGHSDTTRAVNATCEEDGYTLHVCVRCTATWKTDIKERKGHAYEHTATVAATCATEGSKSETCTICKDVRITVIPAKGHDYLRTDSALATCKSDGYEKYVCQTENCNQETIRELPQLSHSQESTVVEPTCDSKGYTLKSCKKCDYATKENVVSALGHEYTPTWNWVTDENGIKVELTLTCSRDEEHSIVKDASVDIQKQVVPTCGTEGVAIYKAIVSYNQEMFEDEYEVLEARANHTMSEEWKYNKTSHYHECEACGSKEDVTEHILDEGVVTTEATCKEEGTKTYTCACGYKEKTVIAALGHDFKDSICTRCDFDADACNHERMHWEEVELTEEDGVCGLYYEYRTCDCGERKQVYDSGVWGQCDLQYKSQYGVDENGYVIYECIAICNECHVSVHEEISFEMKESCKGTRHLQLTVNTANNQKLWEISSVIYEEQEHVAEKVVSTIDMSQYGLCGGTVMETTCLCGEAKSHVNNTECNWVYQSGYDNGLNGWTYKYICNECGTIRLEEQVNTGADSCTTNYTTIITFSRDGKDLIAVEDCWKNISHDWIYQFVLDGKNCDDGYTVNATCKDCEAKDSWHETAEEGAHYTYKVEEIAMPEDSCGGTIMEYACPCGETGYIGRGTSNCSMMYDGTDKQETDAGYIETNTYACYICDYKYISKHEYTLVDYECQYEVKDSTTYWYGDEKLGEGWSNTYTNHVPDYQKTEYTLQGSSCYDGVKITRTCTSCGEVYSYSTDWHEQLVLERYQLAEYGMCGGELIERGCACGEEKYFETSGENSCNWIHYYYDNKTKTEVYKCKDCGTYRHNKIEEKNLGNCEIKYTESTEYLKGYQVVLSTEGTRTQTGSHIFLYTFVLNKENGTCSDGYQVTQTCKVCGDTNTYTSYSEPGYHNTYTVEHYDLTEYGFCGGSIAVSECPCGTQSNVYANIYGPCDWYYDHNAYDDETGTSYYRCANCSNVYSYSRTEAEPDGCYDVYELIYKFYDANMNEKISVVGEDRYSNHDSVYTFKLNGTKCSDGYSATETCKNCGYTGSWWNPGDVDEDYHPTYTTKTYDMEELGFCGGTIEINECPCGEEQNYNRWSECSFSSSGPGDTYTGECITCEGHYTCQTTRTEIDACHTKYAYEYRWYNKDDVEVLNYTNYSTSTHHDYEVVDYKMNGDSCEDGVEDFLKCKDCGYETEEYHTYHNTRAVKKYDLTEYGACEGANVELRQCHMDTDQLEGLWICDSVTSYEFYSDHRGVMHVGKQHYPFSYKLRGRNLKIDFESKDIYDCVYRISVEGDLLTLEGKRGTTGGTYELAKKDL